MKTYKISIDEAKKDSVGIFVGRFQPVSVAHTDIINTIGKNHKRGIVYLVKGKKSDKAKNPFSEKTQIEMLKKIISVNVSVEVLPSAFFVDEINEMPESKFVIYAGTDRIKQYARFEQYLEGGRTLETKEIKRTATDVSATKIRKAITDNDKNTFQQMTPKEIHGMFNKLQQEISKKWRHMK